jgi:diguanylate cyclase (GGDEF)-like protein/PAS domain S-box-containing protein
MSTFSFEAPKNLTEASIFAALTSTGTGPAKPSDSELVACLLENLRDGIVFVDKHGRIQTWSQAVEVMTGISSRHAIGGEINPGIFNLTDKMGKPVPAAACPFAACLRTGKPRQDEYRIVGRSGREVKAEFKIIPVAEGENTTGAVVIIQDSSVQLDLQRQLKDLYAMSMLDPLTRVANRSEFERVLNEYVKAHHTTDFECSLIICDIDFFKQINDNYGHNVGDQALISFAQLLKNFVRSHDVVARYGGEEFVILCANCDIDAAMERAEEIRVTLTKTPQQMLNGKCITASFGVSQLKKSDTATEFFVRADHALLNAKETGRNKVVSANASNGTAITMQNAETQSLAGIKWRKLKGQSLICEEFKTQTPMSMLVESLRGYILETEADIRKVAPEYACIKIDTQSKSGVKGSFWVDIDIQEAIDNTDNLVGERMMTFIRINVKAAKAGWFSSNANELAPSVITELRRYLMITEESAKLTIAPAATQPGKR